MILLYLAAGINHFFRPLAYRAIIPPFLPFPLFLVYFTGLAEVFFALLLIPPATRRTAAWLVAGLLILVFPANIYMAVGYTRAHSPYAWLTWLRLPLQIPLIAWALVYARPLPDARS